MILFPAIDLKGGKCVRLLRGEMDQATIYNEDSGAQAKAFAEAGCGWIHVVDLDGAFSGKSENGEAVKSILSSVDIPVQLGGGIIDRAGIEVWLEAGVSRVILGTIALRDPALVIEACKAYPGKIAVGIDARGGQVAVEGWAETSDIAAKELALKFEDAGVAAIIFTDIDRDGALEGPNLKATGDLAEALSTPVIASGGVSSADDLRQIATLGDKGVIGAIVGRALYDGRVSPREAVAALQSQESAA